MWPLNRDLTVLHFSNLHLLTNTSKTALPRISANLNSNKHSFFLYLVLHMKHFPYYGSNALKGSVPSCKNTILIIIMITFNSILLCFFEWLFQNVKQAFCTTASMSGNPRSTHSIRTHNCIISYFQLLFRTTDLFLKQKMVQSIMNYQVLLPCYAFSKRYVNMKSRCHELTEPLVSTVDK